MNLSAIANGMTSSVNPNMQAILKVNEGYEVDDYGDQIPKFIEHTITIQTQSMSTADLERLNYASQQGQFLYAYANGSVSSLRRSQGKGAEMMIFKPYGEDADAEWLVKQVVESYPDWVKVVLWRQ